MKKAKNYLIIIGFVIIAAGIISSILILSNRSGNMEEPQEGEYEEITMVLPTYGYVPEDMDKVIDALNEISMRKVGVRVNYVYVGSTELNHSCRMRLRAGESIDLMPVLENDGLTALMEEDLLMPLNDLLETDAPEILELTYPRIWDALGKDGTIYAISVGGKLSDWAGVIFMKEVTEAADINFTSIIAAIDEAWDLSNVQKIDTVITPVLSACHSSTVRLTDGSWVAEKQVMPGLNGYGGVFSQMPLIDYDGYGNLLGVTLGADKRIVNLFETEEYAEQIALLKKWEENGYIYHLQSTIDEDPAVVYDRRDALCFFSSLGVDNVVPGKAYDRGDEIYIPFIRNKLTSDFFRVGTWVIPQGTSHPEAVMKILKLMYSDEDYIRTFHGNVEGVENYKIPLGWLFGNSLLATESYEASLKEKEAYADMKFSTYFGFVYEAGVHADTIARLQQILDDYLPRIENGIVEDVDAALKELNQKLYDAGLQEIIDDKQAQLDVWIENH